MRIRFWICRVYSTKSWSILVLSHHSRRLVIIEWWRLIASLVIHLLLLHLGATYLKHRLLLLCILWRSLGLLSLLFLHLILIVLNRFDVEFLLLLHHLILTLFWVAEILTRDAGENVSVVLVQILLGTLLAKLIPPAFRSTTKFLVL